MAKYWKNDLVTLVKSKHCKTFQWPNVSKWIMTYFHRFSSPPILCQQSKWDLPHGHPNNKVSRPQKKPRSLLGFLSTRPKVATHETTTTTTTFEPEEHNNDMFIFVGIFRVIWWSEKLVNKLKMGSSLKKLFSTWNVFFAYLSFGTLELFSKLHQSYTL